MKAWTGSYRTARGTMVAGCSGRDSGKKAWGPAVAVSSGTTVCGNMRP